MNITERAYFKEYKEVMIYHIDYSSLRTEKDFLEVLDFTNKFRKENLETKNVGSQLMCVNMTDSFVFGEIFKRLKVAGKAAKPYLRKQAVVSVFGGKKVFLKLYNLFVSSDLKAFATMEEALEWLIND